MKKILSIILIALAIPVSGMAVPKHRLGTYNLRIQTAKDSADKSWDNRKEYIARTIEEGKFDVIGFQEIANDRQETDLKTLLPDYEIVAWGRNSASVSKGERVGVAYRKARYTLLEKGHFFLSENPDTPALSWDAAYKRVSVYVKLQDKKSGEIFCFCSTHLDHIGTIARKKGAELNISKVLEAAEGHPAFIVGDLNAEPQEVSVHRIFGKEFKDSRSISGKKPKGYAGTYCNWLQKPTEQRIDYIYCRKADVLSYRTITKDYRRSIMPSDHLCVQIDVRLHQ